MSLSAFVKELRAAGVSDAKIVDALVNMEEERKANGRARVAKHRNAKRNGNVTHVTSPSKEKSPKPPKETQPLSSEPDGSDAAASSGEKIQDARDVLFSKPVLAFVSKHSGNPRALIGRWLRDSADDAGAVLAALRRAQSERVADLAPWMTNALKPRAPPRKGNGMVDLIQRRMAERERQSDSAEQDGTSDAHSVIDLLPAPSNGSGDRTAFGGSVLQLAGAGQGRVR